MGPLVDEIQDRDWEDEAACRHVTNAADVFFSEDLGDIAAAKRVCGECPVLAPCLEGLTFIGRAVTPPQRPRRFDARFFMAVAEEVLIDDRPAMDGAELADIKWVTLEDALALDLPTVTRFMLGEISARLASPDKAIKPPFMRLTRRGYARDRIEP